MIPFPLDVIICSVWHSVTELKKRRNGEAKKTSLVKMLGEKKAVRISIVL